MRADAPSEGPRALDGRRSSVVAVLGLCAGALATLLAAALPAQTAPLALLVVLLSTLLAGRLVPIGPALAHGAGAWMIVALAASISHRGNSVWHGIPALWLLLLLVEDMALIGRVGYVRQLVARRRKEHAA